MIPGISFLPGGQLLFQNIVIKLHFLGADLTQKISPRNKPLLGRLKKRLILMPTMSGY
jgi:hypothetical protein